MANYRVSLAYNPRQPRFLATKYPPQPMIEKAMILAAGRGERLRPLTDTIPKPLIAVGDLSLIEHHLAALARADIREIVINLAHLGEKIRATLGNGERYGIKIDYSMENQGALETAGGIRHALPVLGNSPFLVINGDIRCDINFSDLALSDDANMHLVMVSNPPHHTQGDFWMNTTSHPARLVSDQSCGTEATERVTFSGIGIYRPGLFCGLPPGPSPLAPLIRAQIALDKVTAVLHQGYWMDVGTSERLQQVRERESQQA